MSGAAGNVLCATICFAVGEAGVYPLWFSLDGKQYVTDLSSHTAEAAGLTGIAYHNGRIYLAVQSHLSRMLVLDMTLNVARRSPMRGSTTCIRCMSSATRC